MDCLVLVTTSLVFFILLYGVARVSYSIWLKPKSQERLLKQQGISGRAYKQLVGDMKQFIKQITEAWSKPINLCHHIVPRVDPFTLDNVQKYGKISYCCTGTRPRLIIQDPEMMKEVLANKQGHFQKPPLNPQILILSRGISTLEGEQWSKRRKMISPAFHLEKLKRMVPIFSVSCGQMIEQWKERASLQSSCEIDVWPELQKFTADAISRTAFGSRISVPAGVDLTLPILFVNHDPGLWGEDAEEFKPERFSQGVSKASKDQLAFFAFGWGPRTCIGQNFAVIEAKVALAMILQHFSFKLSPSYSHAPYTVMTLQPQHGAQIILHQIHMAS